MWKPSIPKGYGKRLTPGDSLLPVASERLRRNGIDLVLLGIAYAWIWFTMTGLRMPWTPIVVTDESSGGAVRQMFFTGCAGYAVAKLIFTGSYNQVMGFHMLPMLLGFLLVGSVAWSNDPVLTIKRSMVYMMGVHVLIAVVANSRWPMTRYMKAIVYTVGFSAIVSILAHFGLPKACTTIEMRPGLAGVSPHPNVYGPCLGIAISLSFGVPTFSSREKLWLRTCQVFLFLAMALSNSVTATIAMLLSIGIYVILTATSYRAGLMQIAAVAGFSLIQLIGVENLKKTFFAAAGRDEKLSGRDVLWAAVFREGLKSPIFGTGYGSFWYEGRGREITGTWNPRQSHNAYLDIFVDVGIIGLAYVMWFTHSRFLLAWLHWAGPRGSRKRNAFAACLSMCVTLCYIGAFGESFYLKLDKFQFFSFLWLIIVLGNRDKNHIGNEWEEIEREHADTALQPRRVLKTRLGTLDLPRPVSSTP